MTTDHFGEKYSGILWDKRIVERRLKTHQLSTADLQKHLKSLPEERDNSDELIVGKEGEKKRE